MILFSMLFVCLSFVKGFGQIQENPVRWETSIEEGKRDTLLVSLKATIKDGWHINSQFNAIKEGPLPTVFKFEKSQQYTVVDKVVEPKPLSKVEKAYDNKKLYYFEHEVEFVQKIIPKTTDSITVKGAVTYMSCSDTMCLPPETEDIAITYKPQHAINAVNLSSTSEENTNIGWVFLGGLLGGFLALLTPCVFSMIPLTVSYFTKNGGIKKAITYAASIIVIYVALGLIITLTLGPDALNAFASNGIVNLIFFLIFVVFALSFFGAFEITLPNSWLSKSDKMSDKGGYIGIFFMAFTLALVSFSCTGPIIGSLLVQAAISGSIVSPAAGMFGFALALSIPFMLFAAFPSMLKKLPKSGSWLGKVKVILGFLELALAMKFLSTFDLVYQLGFLKREVFIAVWIVIFTLFGFYMLGKLNFAEYENKVKTSISGFISSIVIFSFVVYLIPGLWGAPVKLASGFLPPSFYKEWNQNTQVLDTGISNHSNTATADTHSQPCPQNLNCFHDYNEGVAYAKKINKPILLDFTGWSCVNCRKMEDNVWSDPMVWDKLNNNYVLISLYVDDTTPLPKDEQFVSRTTGKKIKTIGNKWSDFQTTKFKTNSQPYYVVVDTNGDMLHQPIAYEPNVKKYAEFLQVGINKFK
ncbi:hypothetical protein DN748_16705 [Sinomicrobium soli]|nr:hypothetical protein DN748_16705 [Sinomicrobium sp. N-1-3-6]